MKVAVFGDGAWGTAISLLLADNGHPVTMWCHDKERATAIQTTRYNEVYLPGFHIPDTILATADSTMLYDADVILVAVPVKFFRAVLEHFKNAIGNKTWVLLNKGIEAETAFVPSQILNDVLGEQQKTVVISGPSFAYDLANKQLTAVTSASIDKEVEKTVSELLTSSYFYTESSDDVIGVQLCAAVKNVITVGIGILIGAGKTDNTKALFLVEGLSEMKTLLELSGGKQETVYSFAGVGDVVLTSFGKHSKNLALGQKIGQGDSLDEIIRDTPTVAEGLNSAISINQIITTKKLSLPLLHNVYKVLHEGLSLDDFLKSLIPSE